MIFFNFEELSCEANGDPLKLVKLLKMFKENRLLKYGLKQKLVGHSFLLNPDYLFTDKSTDILYIYQYLLLASKRDYSLYKLHGLKSLPLSYYPEINLNSIKNNPLLTITKSEIHFKYEE
jgi:hypothetical protein